MNYVVLGYFHNDVFAAHVYRFQLTLEIFRKLAIEKLTAAGFDQINVTGIKADRANHYLLAVKP